MAKTTVTQITDDLDGSKDAAEVAFSFDGVDYTIDLSKKNAAAMAKALKPYLDVMSRQVVVPADGCAADRGVDPVVIVEVEPVGQGGSSFGF